MRSNVRKWSKANGALKRVLLRNVPELKAELELVANAFDPWARDRGGYYTLAWAPRKDAEFDDAFK